MTRLAAHPVAPSVLEAGTGRRRVPGRALRWALVAAGLAGLVAGVLVGGGTSPEATVLADAGPVTAWAAPVVALSRRVLAVVAVGSLLVPALLAPAGAAHTGLAGVRATRGLPLVLLGWAVVEVAGVVVLSSTLTATPLWHLGVSAVAGTATFPGARTALATAGLLVVLSAVTRGLVGAGATGPATSRLLLVLVVGAAVAPVLTSHGSSGDGHVVATAALAGHVVAALLWVGGLLALLRVHAWLLRPAVAYRRFGVLAVAAVVALAVTGVLAALEIAQPATPAAAGALLVSGYGVLLLAKTAALAGLAAMGWWHRRVTLPSLAAGRAGALRRLAAVEVVLMLATVGVAVALAASPPPAPAVAPGGEEAPSGAAPVTTGGPDGSVATGEAAPDGRGAGLDDMAGHDHGDLQVGVLVDDERFHVGRVVRPGQRVTVYNESRREVTLTAVDGSFDVTVRGRTFATFEAPAAGDHPFTSRHDPGFADVLVVREP